MAEGSKVWKIIKWVWIGISLIYGGFFIAFATELWSALSWFNIVIMLPLVLSILKFLFIKKEGQEKSFASKVLTEQKCRYCDMTIPARATRCPYCRSKLL